jgi:hypothetical protein
MLFEEAERKGQVMLLGDIELNSCDAPSTPRMSTLLPLTQSDLLCNQLRLLIRLSLSAPLEKHAGQRKLMRAFVRKRWI